MYRIEISTNDCCLHMEPDPGNVSTFSVETIKNAMRKTISIILTIVQRIAKGLSKVRCTDLRVLGSKELLIINSIGIAAAGWIMVGKL